MIQKKGFTIIEVLIVLMLTSIFLVMSVARYREFSVRQEVSVAKREIISDLRQAQKDAISGRKPQSVSPSCTGDLQGYAFRLVSGTAPAEYTISVICNAESVIKTNTMPTNTQLAVSQDPIIFQPFTLGTNIAGTATITVSTLGNISDSQDIVINQNGEIN